MQDDMICSFWSSGSFRFGEGEEAGVVAALQLRFLFGVGGWWLVDGGVGCCYILWIGILPTLPDLP